jgi:hypothetical protein
VQVVARKSLIALIREDRMPSVVLPFVAVTIAE